MKGYYNMSCYNRDLSDLDTRVYSTRPASSEGRCCCPKCPFYPPYPPFPPFPPVPPVPPIPPVPPTPIVNPTSDYALFTNTGVGIAYTAGENIPYQTTVYNTDVANISNLNGVVSLSGGPMGRVYKVDYQVTGTSTDATVGLAINGTVDENTVSAIPTTGTPTTANGSYIVNVPANTTVTAAVQVASGTLTTTTPASGTNLSVVRIA